MPKFIVELAHIAHSRVIVDGDTIGDAIARAQVGDFEEVVWRDTDTDGLAHRYGLRVHTVKPAIIEAVRDNGCCAGDIVAGVVDAYPIADGLPDRIVIAGSHGEFEICGRTGEVLPGTSKKPVPDEYRPVVRVDVAEYARWCAAVGIEPARVVDILLVGYWRDWPAVDVSSVYVPPESEARDTVLAALRSS